MGTRAPIKAPRNAGRELADFIRPNTAVATPPEVAQVLNLNDLQLQTALNALIEAKSNFRHLQTCLSAAAHYAKANQVAK